MMNNRNMPCDYPMYGGGIMPPIGAIPPTYMPPTPLPETIPDGNGMYNGVEYKLNNLQKQINMLEERVSKLEGKNHNHYNNDYNNKYNDSNYYML